MHIFYLKKQKDAEVNKQFHVGISDRFAALVNFDDNMDVNRA
jgi:hypothetical protein